MKKTPWFPASVKPVREGWYETTCSYCGSHYWDGKEWKYDSCYASMTPVPQPLQNYYKWRGIRK